MRFLAVKWGFKARHRWKNNVAHTGIRAVVDLNEQIQLLLVFFLEISKIALSNLGFWKSRETFWLLGPK